MIRDFPILIVEDDIVTRRLLERQLTKEGHPVVSVANGHQALDQFHSRFFPIVISDWMMPEMDGPTLCQAIRKKESKGYVFFILLTAKSKKSDIVSGLESGADDYLTKPFDRAELIARIKTGLRILRLERSLKKAYEDIRILSITDPLTGCYNRGYLRERFPKEIERAREFGHPISILISDIDYFKRVNDDFGHQIGDLVLKKFSANISDSIRENLDWVVRYGGEEFLIILPELDLDEAMVLGEKLRQSSEALQFQSGSKIVKITASFGGVSAIFTACDDLLSMEKLIQKADMLLYKAKQDGRNRIYMKSFREL